MDDFKNLLFTLKRKITETITQSDHIKGYLNKMNDSLILIKRCFVALRPKK
jgi:hypothetical protein